MIQIRNGQPIWGIIALLCVDSLYFFSTPFIREQAYNFFFRSHVVSVILLLPAVCLFHFFISNFSLKFFMADVYAQACDTPVHPDLRCCIRI